MNMLKNINIALSFVLELLGIIIISYWGFAFSTGKIIQISLGIGLPLLLIIVWSIWCAPSSPHRLIGLSLVIVKCLIFGLITLCLVSRNHVILGIVFAVLVMINLGVSIYFKTI